MEIILNAGYTKPLYTLELSDKVELVKTLKLHYTLLRSLAEINQFKEGLMAHGVADSMVKFPILMKPLFVHTSKGALTAGEWVKLLYMYTVDPHISEH